MSFEYWSQLQDHNLRRVLTATSFGLVLSVAILLPTMCMLDNASGQGIDVEETTEQNNIKLARQVIEAFNTGDVSNISQFISPQYFNHESQVDPVRGQLRGPDEFIDTIKNLRHAFPDIRHQEQAIISQGDMVVSIINVTGTNTGNFFILPPTGNKINYEAVHIYRIGEDGKVVEHKAIRDDLTFMNQLGVVGPKSAEYERLFQAWKGLGK